MLIMVYCNSWVSYHVFNAWLV